MSGLFSRGFSDGIYRCPSSAAWIWRGLLHTSSAGMNGSGPHQRKAYLAAIVSPPTTILSKDLDGIIQSAAAGERLLGTRAELIGKPVRILATG